MHVDVFLPFFQPEEYNRRIRENLIDTRYILLLLQAVNSRSCGATRDNSVLLCQPPPKKNKINQIDQSLIYNSPKGLSIGDLVYQVRIESPEHRHITPPLPLSPPSSAPRMRPSDPPPTPSLVRYQPKVTDRPVPDLPTPQYQIKRKSPLGPPRLTRPTNQPANQHPRSQPYQIPPFLPIKCYIPPKYNTTSLRVGSTYFTSNRSKVLREQYYIIL